MGNFDYPNTRWRSTCGGEELGRTNVQTPTPTPSALSVFRVLVVSLRSPRIQLYSKLFSLAIISVVIPGRRRSHCQGFPLKPHAACFGP